MYEKRYYKKDKLLLEGEIVNKSELARKYGCCWETIDRRLNPEKYCLFLNKVLIEV